MGLLGEQYANGLLNQDPLRAVTSNRNMLAQALKSRQTTPRNALTGQGLLDTAAIGLSPVPVIGDAIGLAADASRFYNEPESRTPLNFGLAALGAIPFIPPLVSMGLGKLAQSQGKTLATPPTGPARNQAGAIVYHGSPHKFDQFDSSKIGTGEGAQAYGHGLYFAENPAVADIYRKNLTPSDDYVDGKLLDSTIPKHLLARVLSDESGNVSAVKDSLNILARPGANKSVAESAKQALKLLESGERPALQTIKPDGSLYKVDLPDEAIAKMLDWDKPLSQQSKEVQKAIKDSGLWPVGSAAKTKTGAELMREVGQKSPNYNYWGGRAGTPQQASNYLQGNGIPGIQYLDGGSRGAGEGTRNFVVFPGNEGLLKILERQ